MGCLERKKTEFDDLLPNIISCQKQSAPAQVHADLEQLRRERDTARTELDQKKEELKRAYKIVEQKDAELHSLQMESVRNQEKKDNEIERLRESCARMDQAKD